jgi:RimJ/RimL family protein N-acetyltransferase
MRWRVRSRKQSTGMASAADYWGRGYATEGARAALRFGFDTLQLREIVATTVPRNVRSRRVMEKLASLGKRRRGVEHERTIPTLEGGVDLLILQADEAAEYEECRFGMAVGFPSGHLHQ